MWVLWILYNCIRIFCIFFRPCEKVFVDLFYRQCQVVAYFIFRSIQFGNEIYSSQKADDVPLVELSPLTDEIFASYSGPDSGLAFGLDEGTNSKFFINIYIYIRQVLIDLISNAFLGFFGWRYLLNPFPHSTIVNTFKKIHCIDFLTSPHILPFLICFIGICSMHKHPEFL